MEIEKKFQKILERFDYINSTLSAETQSRDTNEIISLNKEFSELLPIVEKIRELKKFKKELKDLDTLIEDEEDKLIKLEAEKEKQDISKKIPSIENLDICCSKSFFFPKILKNTFVFFFKYSEIPAITLFGELSPPIASTAIITDFDIKIILIFWILNLSTFIKSSF